MKLFGNKKNLIRIVHEPGTYMDCTPLHGKWCTITLVGQDVGYARVGMISSGKDYILFQFRDKKGLVSKAYVKDIVEVKMTERMLAKEQPLAAQEWDEDINPFTYFVGSRCDIHMHQTHMFEATPGFFGAKVLFIDQENQLMRVRENSRQFNLNLFMICGLMESNYQ